MKGRSVIMVLYLVFLLLPIYWLINMSLKTNAEIVSTMTLYPHTFTFDNYVNDLHGPVLVFGLSSTRSNTS